jgi:hypothetical protein
VDASPERVLDLLYDFEHLRQFTERSRAELLDEGQGWQRVRFTHSAWLWTLEGTFRREIDRPAGSIRFEMESAARSGLPIPLPASSSGEYRVERSGQGTLITYRQDGETDTSMLLAAYMNYARREAIAFAQDLEAYVRSQAR